MDTKHYLTIGIIASCALIVCITVSFAYFAVSLNTNDTGINARSIGSIIYNKFRHTVYV